MTIIEKIKQSVEGATGMPFLYHAAGELNELIARAAELPCAFAFLLDSGTIDDVNGRYHERVTIAVMFCDKTKFDFNALENEQIIDRMKVKSYKWMQSLRMSNALLVVSVNNTQRLYDNTTDILTGFAVNITIEDIEGVGECELPQVVIDVDKNGSYDVVGVDRVRVNVHPILEELEVTQNGEYLPPTDIAGFSKAVVNVLPKMTDLVATENDKEYIANDYGVDGFGKVKTELRNLVKVYELRVTNDCINEDGRWEGETLINTSECTNLNGAFHNCYALKEINVSGFDVSKVKSLYNIFRMDNSYAAKLTKITGLEKWNTQNVEDMSFAFCNLIYVDEIDCSNLNLSKCVSLTQCFQSIIVEELDTRKWNLTNVRDLYRIFWDCTKLKKIDTTNWNCSNVNNIRYAFERCYNLETIIWGKSIDDVLSNEISCFNGLAYSLSVENTVLDRASLRAVINGLADLTGKTPQTLTIGATLLAKLTEEDIAIATNKNWTIV